MYPYCYFPQQRVVQDEQMHLSGFGSRYHSASLHKIPDFLEHKEPIRQYALSVKEKFEDGRGLYLWGDFGTGKTAATAIIAREALSWGLRVCRVTIRKAVKVIIGQEEFEPDVTWDFRFRNVHFLIVDDLHFSSEKTRGFEADIVEDILRERYDDRLPTLISSNLPPSKIEETGFSSMATIFKDGMEEVHVSGFNWREAGR